MAGYHEDDSQRLARNINDLLQELRIAQAGVQILFGFLFSIIFNDAYRRATDVQHGAYLLAVLFTVISVALITAPAAWHRLLFRRGRRPEFLRVSNGFAPSALLLSVQCWSASVGDVPGLVEPVEVW